MAIKREHQVNFWYFVVAVIAIVLLQNVITEPMHVKTIPYSEFQQLVDQGKVADLVVGADQITGTYKVPEGAVEHFATRRVPADLADALAKKNIAFSGAPAPGLLQVVLGWILPSLGFVLLWMFLI